MAALLCILFSVILSSMTPLVFEASDQLIPIVFQVDKTLGQYLSTASSTIYNIGISLMILKFLKKGFEIYVMGTDGDPDMDPLQLVTNFIKAMAVAIGFRPIYDIFVQILKETVNTITTSMNIYKEVTDFTGIGIINGVFFLIAFVIFMILFCKAFELGINMMILNIGMPLACTGLLDNDKGMFKNYFMTYVKTFLTVLIQVVLSKLGLYIIVSSAGIGNIISGNFDLAQMFFGLACMIVAMKAPKLLAEFLVPSGPGGGVMSKIYAVNTIKTAIKGVTK